MPQNSSSKALIFPFCAVGVLVILLYIGFNSSFSASSLSSSRKSLDSSSSSSSPSNSKRNKILCLGDSNTKLSSSRSNRNKNSFGKQFPEYLGDLLVSRNAASHVKILNRGVPNTACTRVRSKYSIWTKDEFKSAMSSSEGLGDEISQRGHFSWSEIGAVTIAFGTNDSRDKIWANPIEFKNCLVDMITQVNRNVVKSNTRRENSISGEDESKNKQGQQRGVVQVLLLTPPPIYSGGSSQTIAKFRVNKHRLEDVIVPIVREVADMFATGGIESSSSSMMISVKLVDVYYQLKKTMMADDSKAKKPDWIDDDGIHLSQVGSQKVAQFIANSMS